MKREIKFRAWDKENKKMAHVSRIDFGPGGIKYLVDDSMLLEYTGLHDENGREIYEGDVVRYTAWHDGKPTDTIQGEVVYSGDLGMASFDIRLDHDGEIVRAVLPARGVEIMGNVFENPELLEGKQ